VRQEELRIEEEKHGDAVNAGNNDNGDSEDSEDSDDSDDFINSLMETIWDSPRQT